MVTLGTPVPPFVTFLSIMTRTLRSKQCTGEICLGHGTRQKNVALRSGATERQVIPGPGARNDVSSTDASTVARGRRWDQRPPEVRSVIVQFARIATGQPTVLRG